MPLHTTTLPLFLALTHATPLLLRQSSTTPSCTPGTSIPALYTFGALQVIYPPSGDGGILNSQSIASFTLTNTQTQTTETLSCTLRGGYTCQLNGTPENPGLTVWLQLNLAAYFSFWDAKLCGGKRASVTGQVDMSFTCPETPIELGQTCVGDVESVVASGWVDGAVP